MDELKPCPFCGREAHIKEVVSCCDKLYTVGCSDSECMGYETWLLKPAKEEAIAAWNRRAERTYHPERVSTAYNSAIVCSECKRRLDEVTIYCPNCGARLEGVGR